MKLEAPVEGAAANNNNNNKTSKRRRTTAKTSVSNNKVSDAEPASDAEVEIVAVAADAQVCDIIIDVCVCV